MIDKIKLCAEAMGLLVIEDNRDRDGIYFKVEHRPAQRYNPLTNDEQAMALVKKFKLSIGQLRDGPCKVFTGNMRYEAEGDDLNTAIVLCVAALQSKGTR